ncbi:MAG: J domain-containing protein [Chitinophagaceae bacterium]
MIEHNYYQLMEIELCADISIVKRRYRELALLYHPDKNPNNKVAEEYFKVLTQGYNILSEPDKKSEYDDLLRNYYSRKSQQATPNVRKDKNAEVREKLKRHAENQRQRIIDEYLRAENVLSHKRRYLLSVLVFCTGILICYNNWFLNFLNFKIMYIVVGSFLFGLGAYMIANIVYKRRIFKKAMSIQDIGRESGPVRLFVILFLVTPILFLMLMQVTKVIHLSFFYDVTVVDRVVEYNEMVTYNYVVNGEEISRQTDAIPNYDYSSKTGLRVKYSRINPNISELVTTAQLASESE